MPAKYGVQVKIAGAPNVVKVCKPEEVEVTLCNNSPVAYPEVLNEVNTLPGMTSYSRYPRMMAAAGMPLTEVIDQLVSLALTSRRRRVRSRWPCRRAGRPR